jgi:hypothetical protein
MKLRAMLAVTLLSLPGTLVAQSPALYTFETAPFNLNATTPFANVAPASGGPAGFTASFANLPVPAGVTVASGGFAVYGFVGQNLFVPTGPQTMTVTLNMPIDGLIVNFAYNSESVDSPARFEAVVGANIYNSSGTILGTSPGGTLSFSNPTPFTSVDFRAFDDAGTQVQWALDNLSLQFAAVPEPTTWALLGVCTVGCSAYALNKRRRNIRKSFGRVK